MARWHLGRTTVIAIGLAFLLSCTSHSTADVVSATCYRDTDTSDGITKPTQFVKLSLSTEAERLVPRVVVILFDESGKQIYDGEYNAGPVFSGDPNVVSFALQTPPRVTRATASCAASVAGYGGYSS